MMFLRCITAFGGLVVKALTLDSRVSAWRCALPRKELLNSYQRSKQDYLSLLLIAQGELVDGLSPT